MIVLISCLILSLPIQAIVPNNSYYISAKHRLTLIDEELKSLNSLVSLNAKGSAIEKIHLSLRTNLIAEKQLLSERVILYKQLEQQSLIMYLNN